MIRPDEIFVKTNDMTRGRITLVMHSGVDDEGNGTTHKYIDADTVDDLISEAVEEAYDRGYEEGGNAEREDIAYAQ